MRFLKRINERGTLTLPHEVRQVLGVDEGDIIELDIVRVIKQGQLPAPATLTEKEPAAPELMEA